MELAAMNESPVRIEVVKSMPHEIARMDRARRMAAEITKMMDGIGLGDWSFMVCAWLPGEQPVIVAGTRPGCDVLASVKDGAQWILKSVEAKQNGDAMPIVTGPG
jgi:hypothetical protein